MNNVHSEFIKADMILNEFTRKSDKFEQRYKALSTDINNFIKCLKLEAKVSLNNLSLGYMLVDYFEDIRRLKEFHGIEHINAVKIVAYTSYWFLKRKPIQVFDCDKNLIYINERFILAYILNFLSGTNDISIIDRENEGLKSFSESLFYFIKYRFNGPNSLELAMSAFFAGQIYQEKEKDISKLVGKCT